MKKIFMAAVLSIVALAVSAQIKSVDIKGDLRSDFGIGLGISGDLTEKFEFSPALNYYFIDDVSNFQLEADFHYKLPVASDFSCYPILGIGLNYAKLKGCDGETDFLVNIGGGVKYDFTPNIAGFVECKYQWIDGGDDTYFSLGVKIGI